MNLILLNLQIKKRMLKVFICLLLMVAGCATNTKLIDENRTDESIQATFQKWTSTFYSVYNKALVNDHDLGGEIIFKITVNKNGHVVNSLIYKSTVKDENFIASINRIIFKMDFGKVKNEKNNTFLYPMKFFPKGVNN